MAISDQTNNLNFSNKHVSLEESVSTVMAFSVQIGQVYKITKQFDKLNNLSNPSYKPSDYGIILYDKNAKSLVIPDTTLELPHWSLSEFKNEQEQLSGCWNCRFIEYPLGTGQLYRDDTYSSKTKTGVIKDGILQGIDGKKYIVILKVSPIINFKNQEVKLEEGIF